MSNIINNFSYEFDYAMHSDLDFQGKTHQYCCNHCETWIEFRPHKTDRDIKRDLERHLMSCKEWKENKK